MCVRGCFSMNVHERVKRITKNENGDVLIDFEFSDDSNNENNLNTINKRFKDTDTIILKKVIPICEILINEIKLLKKQVEDLTHMDKIFTPGVLSPDKSKLLLSAQTDKSASPTTLYKHMHMRDENELTSSSDKFTSGLDELLENSSFC